MAVLRQWLSSKGTGRFQLPANQTEPALEPRGTRPWRGGGGGLVWPEAVQLSCCLLNAEPRLPQQGLVLKTLCS